MKLAGELSLAVVLERLREERSVFHSEADLQHALAWEIHRLDPSLRIRLEVPVDGTSRESVDLVMERPDGPGTFIELKYLKAAWSGSVGGESFALRASGAHDIARYDVVRDIARVERFVAGRAGWKGAVVVLTNDSLHWRAPNHGRATIADAFRIHEGQQLTGSLAWGRGAGQGTTTGRDQAHALVGSYELHWQPYSRLDGSKNGEFRVLVVPVDRGPVRVPPDAAASTAEQDVNERHVPVAPASGMTLHEAMREVLRVAPNRAMSPTDLASQVNRRGLYRMQDGRPVEPSQIHARVHNYPQLFERQGGLVRLKG